MLELGEEALDQIAMSTDAADRGVGLLAGWWKGAALAPLARIIQESVSVMTAVSHDIAALEPFQRREMAKHADHEPEPGVSIS